MIYTKTNPSAGPYHRCRIIRSYIMFTLMLVILAVVAGDKFSHINFLTPSWFAAAIVGFGCVSFLVKLISWKFFNKII